MLPRLVVRLDAAIAQAEMPLERECLKAERAGVLARLGLMQEARFALNGLRSQSQRHRSPRLKAWVWMVDGMVSYFEAIGPQAGQKFLRAHAIAAAADDAPMQALAAAWLAVCAFNASHLADLTLYAGTALRLAAADDHPTRARVGLVLADAYCFAGDDERSRQWYKTARLHAGADGDSTMMSFLLHNIAAMRAGRISLEDAFGRAKADEARHALMEIESTANYDGGAGAAALSAMVPMVRAWLMVVLGRFEEAIALFDTQLARVNAQGSAHRDARFVADRAWCHLGCGRPEQALADARMAERSIAAQFDPDDRAAAHARLARVLAACGEAADAARHQALAQQALLAHEAAQRDMKAALDLAVSSASA